MQNFNNHIRFYPSHHFVFYPIVLGGLFIYLGIRNIDDRIIWIGLFTLLSLVTWLSFMLRQHYPLNNQNRVIRLEMIFRYYILTNRRLEALEQKLSIGQLAALRFASDEELQLLLHRTVDENLTQQTLKNLLNIGNLTICEFD